MTDIETRPVPDAASDAGADPFRQRLLDALAETVTERGYRDTTIADIVRQARTSRRTFYEHFASKEECFLELLHEANSAMIDFIRASVDPDAVWSVQIRQAITAWIEAAKSHPGVTLSWIRELPSLGTAARRLQRDSLDAFVELITGLVSGPQWRAAGIDLPDADLVMLLLGGLRELMARVVEDDGDLVDLVEVAVSASTALLGARPA
ncbi:MAG: TetR/AcrR family transcriptional regulator [Jatrophihabitans sp.]|uniref:TetR/AcrR family transcriptional regulator n=1 Tax=Jatrophihabitans sp. TaxID=1932789 RepID=UPI003F80E98F